MIDHIVAAPDTSRGLAARLLSFPGGGYVVVLPRTVDTGSIFISRVQAHPSMPARTPLLVDVFIHLPVRSLLLQGGRDPSPLTLVTRRLCSVSFVRVVMVISNLAL
jgi:hypothetical protein